MRTKKRTLNEECEVDALAFGSCRCETRYQLAAANFTTFVEWQLLRPRITKYYFGN